MTSPEISVIIPSRNSRRTIGACLTALAHQQTRRAFEVIVVDSSSDRTETLIRDQFPSVRLLHFETRKYPGSARNLAIAAARGRLLLFTDADCIADPHWVDRLAAAVEDSGTTAGGGIENGAQSSALAWAAFFCEFSQWLPSGALRPLDEVPGCNLAMERALFDQFGPFLENVYCSDTHFHDQLHRAGLTARFVPEARVAHHGIESLAHFLSHEVFHGWSYGRLCIAQRRFPPARRALYALALPLIAALLFARITARVFNSGLYLGPLVRSSPLLVLGLLAWTWGEARAYLGLK